MAIRVTCITTDNGSYDSPYLAISNLIWINEWNGEKGNYSREEMYNFILGGGVAFVKDLRGNVANLMTEVSAKGIKYVKTVADETKTDNLLSLQRCP